MTGKSETTSPVPDFGMIRYDFQGIGLECKAIAPGLSLHDLVMTFEAASRGGNPIAGNPSDWPTTRGVKAVADAILKAVFESNADV